MDVLTGALQILASVIAVGGVAKLASPDGFSSLLRTLGLPSSRALSRACGVLEVVMGVGAVVVGGTVAALLVGSAYTTFAVVVLLARRAGAASCGCFGSVASPPSIVHVVVNSVSAAVAFVAAAVDPASLADSLADQPLAAVPYLVTVATAVWLVVVIDTTGAVLADRTLEVAHMGPRFREHSATSPAPARTTHRHRSTRPTDDRT
ncbi:MAG: MauE/DoxX family redox-associated membrane protein [Microthrixaceae bacterium]